MRGLDLEEGSPITLVSGQHKLTLTVRLSIGLDPITITSTDLAKLAPNAAVSGYWLASDPKADAPDVIDAVEQSIPSVQNLGVDGGLAERSSYTKVFDVLLIVGIGLLGVSVLIALVGVGNTLSLSVLERTRENALLRAMGLSRRQLRRMLAFESLMMALVAAGLGILLGLLYGWTGTTWVMPLMSRSCCSALAGIFSLYAVTFRSTGYWPFIDTSNVFCTEAIPTQVRLIRVTPMSRADVVAAVRFGFRTAFATAIRAGTPPPRAGSAPITRISAGTSSEPTARMPRNEIAPPAAPMTT